MRQLRKFIAKSSNDILDYSGEFLDVAKDTAQYATDILASIGHRTNMTAAERLASYSNPPKSGSIELDDVNRWVLDPTLIPNVTSVGIRSKPEMMTRQQAAIARAHHQMGNNRKEQDMIKTFAYRLHDPSVNPKNKLESLKDYANASGIDHRNYGASNNRDFIESLKDELNVTYGLRNNWDPELMRRMVGHSVTDATNPGYDQVLEQGWRQALMRNLNAAHVYLNNIKDPKYTSRATMMRNSNTYDTNLNDMYLPEIIHNIPNHFTGLSKNEIIAHELSHAAGLDRILTTLNLRMGRFTPKTRLVGLDGKPLVSASRSGSNPYSVLFETPKGVAPDKIGDAFAHNIDPLYAGLKDLHKQHLDNGHSVEDARELASKEMLDYLRNHLYEHIKLIEDNNPNYTPFQTMIQLLDTMKKRAMSATADTGMYQKVGNRTIVGNNSYYKDPLELAANTAGWSASNGIIPSNRLQVVDLIKSISPNPDASALRHELWDINGTKTNENKFSEIFHLKKGGKLKLKKK